MSSLTSQLCAELADQCAEAKKSKRDVSEFVLYVTERILQHSDRLEAALATCIAERDNLIGERDRLREQLRKRTEHAERFAGLLNDCLAELEQYSDTRDGSDGRQLPNTAMVLCQQIEEALK